MDTPEPSNAVGCSQQGGSLKEEKCFDSKLVQREHNFDPKTKTEKPHTGDIQSVSKNETKTGGSGGCQLSDQNPIYTWKKTPRFLSPGKRCFQSGANILSEGLQKKVQKAKKAGKYICHYCGRACAKPSVLKKHIRSHTGERPYPCVPCGFSFKTKSNLYKHRKSHTHAVKAGLLSFSEQGRKNVSTAEELMVGEREMQSDNDQSTDTDEEVIEHLPLDSDSSRKHRGDFEPEKCIKATQKVPGITLTPSPSKKDSVSSSGKVSLWQFREMMAPAFVSQGDQEAEPSTIKQKLAHRLSEKRSQDSDHSLSLPSSYSKGSTDSGYFSRSESADHQFSQSSSSAKSYQEIMFGKCYKPSTKPRQSITVQTCMTDTNESTSTFMIKLTKGTVSSGKATSHLHKHKKDLVRSIKIESESFQEEDYQEMLEMDQCSTELLETPSESGLLLRSNSLPTPTDSNVSATQALRSSNSFDERMTNEDVSFRSSMGMRKLMRQTAFEHFAHEGHTESENQALVCGVKSELKVDSGDDSKVGVENYQDFEPCLMFQSHIMENATRKRRKGKSTMEDEYFLTQNKPLGVSELLGDLYTKQDIQDATYSERERRSGSNVISVIQHTNSLSRPSSAEKSTDFDLQHFSKSPIYQLMEKGQIKEEHKNDWSGSSLIYQPSHLSKQLGIQSGIQVPEIRVTEEPDKPEKVQDAQTRPNEKHKEEFQWPQRSETLSNFPVEKLPPKKKRLRLAELGCSSGESSFESACTSLSRSPSQDSNLSPSSSFSQSLDRDENVNIASPTKSEEFSKPLEFLSVPGSSLSKQREMRRSASEQAPCNFPVELPEFRSKSFDYSNLSSSSSPTQVDTDSIAYGFKDRRRGYLVRQASLTGDPEFMTYDKSLQTYATPGSSEISRKVSSLDKQHLLEECCTGIEKIRYSLFHGNVSPQHQDMWIPEQIPYQKQPFLFKTLQMHGIKHKIKKEPEDSKSLEDPRVSVVDKQKDHPQHVSSVFSTIAALSQAQTTLTSTSLLIPVRIQMQVPCYGNLTYTSISHILGSQNTTNLPTSNVITQSPFLGETSQNMVGFDLPQPSEHARDRMDDLHASPAKLKTGIPLSLTSRTISTTEAPSGGASKRMLSPASSIEFFIEATQQKRVRDEKMYGQIVEELSAVELGHPDLGKVKMKKETKSTNIQDALMTVEEIDMDDIDLYSKTGLLLPSSVSQEDVLLNISPLPVQTTTSQSCSTTASPRDSTWILSQFPGLHTTTCVSWCFLNSSKPNSSQSASHFSVYASWFVRCHNPNPPNLSTGMALALLRSKQKRQNSTYTIAAMHQPGILVTSALLNQQQEEEAMEIRVDDISYDTKMKEIKQKGKSSRENSKESDAFLRQTEPIRIKIFEGGYKSNEDYVYVRGRGRGKYICEECGIRCKKPSMLKKHIRTHTDVRPFICKCCNFAFKTKGNLTKHMKSKAHLKKCLELGVSPMNMNNTDIADNEDDVQKSSDSRLVVDTAIKHQFSDADDSDGGEEDGDDPDDDEDDEYDGDSTPRTHSRSTSPHSSTVIKPFSSICFTKGLDTSKNPKERLEASSLINDDDLTLEQASTSYDLCTSQQLSPHWDSPHQRYICLRADLSPQCNLFSRRPTSPLKPTSSRRDLNIRGDFSAVRQLSPVRLNSPGTDVCRHRAQSSRGQHRGLLRASSPRRGAYLHRSYLDQGRGMKCDMSPLRETIGMPSEMDQRDTSLQNLYVSDSVHSNNDTSTPPQQDIFSHLPLHSQRQVPAPIPMVPIGGLRMPSVLPSGAAVERHSQSLPQGDISQRVNPSLASVPILGTRVSNPSSQRKELPSSSTGPASKNKKQEESVYICAEAIASLRISSEDKTDNPPKC